MNQLPHKPFIYLEASQELLYSIGSHLCFENMVSRAQTLINTGSGHVTAFDYNSSENLVASSSCEGPSNNPIKVFRKDSTNVVHELQKHQNSVVIISFSTNGSYLVSAEHAPDNSIFLWNV